MLKAARKEDMRYGHVAKREISVESFIPFSSCASQEIYSKTHIGVSLVVR